MKKVIFLLMLAGIMSSCSTDETTQLIGKWKLIEVLMDPGDGSATFQSVDSEKTIEFFSDGTLVINIFYLCSNGGNEISGTYSNEPSNWSYGQSTILLDCEDTPFPILFNLQNSKLILSYLHCTELCLEKYAKI